MRYQIDDILQTVVAPGVSDIHIESYPGREKIRIRFRKAGNRAACRRRRLGQRRVPALRGRRPDQRGVRRYGD